MRGAVGASRRDDGLSKRLVRAGRRLDDVERKEGAGHAREWYGMSKRAGQARDDQKRLVETAGQGARWRAWSKRRDRGPC